VFWRNTLSASSDVMYEELARLYTGGKKDDYSGPLEEYR
jgi:hypothetical protein